MNSSCFLCDTTLKEIRFSCKNTLTEYSKIPLLSVIEDMNEAYFTLGNAEEWDICVTCCDLINKVDKLKIKLLQVCNILKKYLGKKYIHIKDESFENFQDSISNSIVPADVNVTEDDINLSEIVETGFQENEENLLDGHQTDDIFFKDPVIEKLSDNETLPEIKSLKRRKSLKTEVLDSTKPFVCEVCGQAYKRKSNFEVHIKIHKGINPFTCTYCSKSFTQKISLTRHLPLHTGDKPHQCETCGKRFIHHTSFINHKLIHNGIKSFKCSTCNESFRTSSHLKRHIRVHTGEKKFECTVCHRKFAERYNLMVHHKLHVNSSLETLTNHRHSCQICGETFERRLKLEEHKFKKHLSVFHDKIPKIEKNQENVPNKKSLVYNVRNLNVDNSESVVNDKKHKDENLNKKQ